MLKKSSLVEPLLSQIPNLTPNLMPDSIPNLIPFTRPAIDEATIAGVCDILRSGQLTTGKQNLLFESALSQHCNGRLVRTCTSGTATLAIACQLAGIGSGCEVITTALSWVATSNVILLAGATPVFVDVDSKTRNINLDQIAAAITPKTKAIMPVDLAGLPVDRNQLYDIAQSHHLRVIEDAAQSFGASWHGKPIGSFGDLISFSFHANKNITTIEGGALVVNNQAEATLAEKYRFQGVTRSGVDEMEVDILGSKSNLSDVAARIGLGQLNSLAAFTSKRQQLARHYFACFQNSLALNKGLELPLADFENCNWHMFQVVLPASIRRSQFMQAMHSQGIATGVHYRPIHRFALYQHLDYRAGSLPQTERIGESIVTLPLYPGLTQNHIQYIVETINTFFSKI